MAYRDILHITDQYIFCDNTFCNNTELTRSLDADNPSATEDFPTLRSNSLSTAR